MRSERVVIIAKEEQIFVGARVEGMPSPMVESEKRFCDKCGKEIWVDKRMIEIADSVDSRFCIECMLDNEGIDLDAK